MSEHCARIVWHRGDEKFVDARYSRQHWLQFDGGAEISASSSPLVVPLPWSDQNAVDPEELFVAALASCHMLWFLSLAARAAWCVDRYLDHPTGVMAARDGDGKLVMTKVFLRPETVFSGQRVPTLEELIAVHEQAHAACFLANSVHTEIDCQPSFSCVAESKEARAPRQL